MKDNNEVDIEHKRKHNKEINIDLTYNELIDNGNVNEGG